MIMPANRHSYWHCQSGSNENLVTGSNENLTATLSCW